MTRVVAKSKDISLLAYPPPFQCWFALSSDPDFTTIENWHETHSLIWQDLELPFADSLFVMNKNLQLPNQVCLTDHAEYIQSHPHDTIHTWGDFALSGNYRFTRDDAIAASAILSEHGLTPLVWTDHSNFIGNLLHRPHVKASRQLRDASGHEYFNDLYTLDLIRNAGVRYVWNGRLTKGLVGQDRALSRLQWYRESSVRFSRKSRALIALGDILTLPARGIRNQELFSYMPDSNRQYEPYEFPDGTKFYTFGRFGSWRLGDIHGISEILTADTMRRLINAQGTMILYTHLGKRRSDSRDDPQHIPRTTHKTFSILADHYRNGRINLSSTSKLLDYLVLRDNVTLRGNEIHFEPDEIRFPELNVADLSGHAFGLISPSSDVHVFCNGNPTPNIELENVGENVLLRFA